MRTQVTEVVLAVRSSGSVAVRSSNGPWRIDGDEWPSWVDFANAVGIDGWELFSKAESAEGRTYTLVFKRAFPGAGRTGPGY